jgi:hypothetical protein
LVEGASIESIRIVKRRAPVSFVTSTYSHADPKVQPGHRGLQHRNAACRAAAASGTSVAFRVRMAPRINGMRGSPFLIGNEFQMKGRPPVTATVAPVV